MSNGENRTAQNTERLHELVKRVLVDSGSIWLTNKKKGYEVHPALIWPLPLEGFRCRFLGVTADQLDRLGVLPLQAEMDNRCDDLPWLTRAAHLLSQSDAYRAGGCWHLAMSPTDLVLGAHQQRLILFAMLQAATKDLTELGASLRDTRDLSLVVPSKSWAQRIVSLDGELANQRDQAWDLLAQGRSEHWIRGMNIQSAVSHDHISPLDIFSNIDQIQSTKGEFGTKVGLPIKTTLFMRPAGVAFALGLRGRIYSAAESKFHKSEPAKIFESWIWTLSERSRRLLVHIVACPLPTNGIESSNFKHLRDPYFLATIFGWKISIFNKNIRKRLVWTLRKASMEIIESRPVAFAPFVERILLPFLTVSQRDSILVP